MKIMVPFAEGFEEIEALTSVDVLRRANIDVITVSLEKEIVKGSNNIKIVTDCNINNIKTDDLDGIILPGGMPGAEHLRNSNEVINIIRELNKQKKMIAAICAAPIVLEKAGIIKNKKVTSYPGFEKDLNSCDYLSDRIVFNDNIITARGPGVALEFAIAIIEYLVGKKHSDQIKEDMLTNF